MDGAVASSRVLLTGANLVAGLNVHGILTGAPLAGRSEINEVFWERRLQ